MSTPGVPDRTECEVGEHVPAVIGVGGQPLDVSEWRCTSCGQQREMDYGNAPIFGNCNCGGRRWSFISAKSRY